MSIIKIWNTATNHEKTMQPISPRLTFCRVSRGAGLCFIKVVIMNIDKMTFGEIKELMGMFSPKTTNNIVEKSSGSFFKTGEKYFIRTVTMYYTGRLIDQNENELLLENVAWIADTGRFSDALKSGRFDEVEPYPQNTKVIIPIGCILDASIFEKELPNEKK